MQIIVNGLPAVIKKGTSIEYVSENPLFGGADGYSFSITFPLRGCSENRAIFGHLDRVDAQAHTTLIRNCEIVDRKLTLSGALAVTEITETEVKAQFLQGRSVQNFDASFDDIYIDELDLGPSYTSNYIAKDGQYEQDDPNRWKYIDRLWATDDLREVSLPYVTPEGEIRFNPGGNYSTHAQRYLGPVIESVCNALGYNCVLTDYYSHLEYKWLLVCNTIPLAWGLRSYARALPHWTVSEFFEKLELFLAGEFTIDHQSKWIIFQRLTTKYGSIQAVELSNVVQEVTTEVTVENPNVDYLPMTNFGYSDRDDQTYKFDCCPNFTYDGQETRVGSVSDLKALLSTSFYYDDNTIPDYCQKIYITNDYQGRKNVLQITNREQLTEQDPDTGRIRVWDRYFTIPRPLGFHSPRISDYSDSATTTELDFIPARIEHNGTGKSWLLFLNYNSYNESDTVSEEEDQDSIGQTKAVQALINASDSGQSEYYDKIYLGIYSPGACYSSKSAHPFTVPYYFWRTDDDASPELKCENDDYAQVFNLNVPGSRFADIRPAIDKRRKTTFKWLTADQQIPDPNAIFHIKGRRWICAKITATITERGLSDLLKGTFYPIDEA